LLALGAVSAIGAFGITSSAQAATNTDLGYTRTQVYSAALRYLRIDLGFEITEQDAEAAYLLFRYKAEGIAEPRFGAFEIVETRAGVRLWVKLPEMPSYHEQVLKDGLLKKLRQDYGEPPAKAEPPKPATPSKPGKPAEGSAKPGTSAPFKST
jgi:uncharacterized membrane protein